MSVVDTCDGNPRPATAKRATPAVSVVMPVYNQEGLVGDAVRSILSQTFHDFEFVIVDDGSTDRTREVLATFSDPRLRVIESDHAGFIHTLQKGVELARAPLVARMDSDDLSHRERLAKQVRFLDEHPEFGFVGSLSGLVTLGGKALLPLRKFGWEPLKPAGITLRPRLFPDATGVFRRALAERVGFYDLEFDNENPLWYRLMREAPAALLGDCLYFVRVLVDGHSRSVESLMRRRRVFAEIRQKYDPDYSASTTPMAIHAADPELHAFNMQTRAIGLCVEAGDLSIARRLAWRCLLQQPLRRRSWRRIAEAITGKRSLPPLWKANQRTYCRARLADHVDC
ncbi:MAG: glycosyltransferase family A protein [Planctomycetia bacterium]|nr:glycosyltransferase family A protein [Planctomycetia bacterium]